MFIKSLQKHKTLFSQLEINYFSQIQVFLAHLTGLALAVEAAARAQSTGT